jgi:hypothetical protein
MMGRLPKILADQISLELSNKSVSLTDDQQREILKIRRYWYAISRCLESFYSDQADPFKAGYIKVSHVKFEDFILCLSDLYKKLMLLTYEGYPAIEREADRLFGEFPFNSRAELFVNVLLEEVIKSVEDIFHPYKEISNSNIQKSLKYALDKLPDLPLGSPPLRQLPEMRKIFNQNKYSGWYWDAFMIRTLAASALQQPECPNRQLTSQSLKNCKTAQESLFRDFYLRGYRRRGEWAKVFSKSYAWNQGKICYWDPKTGGYTDCR